MKDFSARSSYTRPKAGLASGRGLPETGGHGARTAEQRGRKGFHHGHFYQAADPLYWVIWLFILFALMAFNELGRTSLWAGIALFAVVPIVLTVFVWPTTAAPGNEYGTGTWFNWVKTYSALAGCLGFMALRFAKWRGADGKTHHLDEKRWALCFPRRSSWR